MQHLQETRKCARILSRTDSLGFPYVPLIEDFTSLFLFLFAKDTNTEYVWSNTYAPVNEKPDNYEVVFASDSIKYLRTDDKVMTKTEIVVTRDHHSEIRKITFKNNSDEDSQGMWS